MQPTNYQDIRRNVMRNTLVIKNNQKQVRKLSGSQRRLIIDVFSDSFVPVNEKQKNKIIALNKKLQEIIDKPESHKRSYNPFTKIAHFSKSIWQSNFI